VKTAALVGALLLAGCIDGLGIDGTLAADVDQFAATAWPTMALHCASSGCHGTPERPLALYARSEWRADPADLVADPALTDDELAHNAIASLAFVRDAQDVDAAALLARPLHPEAGGSDHGGGAQFADAEDPDYLALRAWVMEVML